MKYVLGIVFLCMFAAPAPAADLISPYPHCAVIRNDTPSYILASIRTAYGKNNAGGLGRHESSFRLDAGEKKEACVTGPFYPGYQVEFVIKTMIPVFSCKTAMKGTIIVSSKRDADDRNIYTATCVPPLLFP